MPVSNDDRESSRNYRIDQLFVASATHAHVIAKSPNGAECSVLSNTCGAWCSQPPIKRDAIHVVSKRLRSIHTSPASST